MTQDQQLHPADAQPMLPGLGDETPHGLTELEKAARRTLAELHAQELLDERHALLCQLILDLSRAVAAGTRSGRASAAAMAAAQLLSAIDQLPKPPEGGGEDDDAWSELAADLRAAAGQRGGQPS